MTRPRRDRLVVTDPELFWTFLVGVALLLCAVSFFSGAVLMSRLDARGPVCEEEAR